MPIRILIADDHPIVRSGIQNELSQRAEFEIIGEAIDGEEALQKTRDMNPDVLLLDVYMPGLKAIEVLRQLKREGARTRIVVLTAHHDPGIVFGMLKAGADGYLLKDEEPSVISEAVNAIALGNTWLSPSVAKIVAEQIKNRTTQPQDLLTKRELEILGHVAEGLTNKEIARLIDLTERTIEFHMTNILIKLGMKSRVKAALWAKDNGIPEKIG